MNDPIVIDPPGFDQKAAWEECRQYVDSCGGLTHEDGEPNWRAAFGADPGLCSCPCCHETYWCWGRRQKCAKCGFCYPTDWWPMYSYGAQHRQRLDNPPPSWDADMMRRIEPMHQERMGHKYYRWAFENRATPSTEAAKVVAWRTIFPEDASERPTAGLTGTEGMMNDVFEIRMQSRPNVGCLCCVDGCKNYCIGYHGSRSH